MDETNSCTGARRVFLRFRTVGAPSDEDIINAFYSKTGLSETDCYFHWQPRKYEHTHTIVDIHHGSPKQVHPRDRLPHEVFAIKWSTDHQL